MFWGIVLKANKKYSQKTTKSFHVSQAVLDPSSSSGGPNQVFLSYENTKYLICVLENNKCIQVPLDLNFAAGEEISFQSLGNGSIHLSGYLTEIADDFDVSDEEEMESEMETSKDSKKNGKETKLKSKKVVKDEEDEDDSDEEDDADITGDLMDDDEHSENDSDDEDEEEDDDDDDDSDEEVQQPKPKQIKLDKQAQQNGEKTVAAAATKKDKKNKKDKQANAQKQSSPGEKVIQGGVKIQDIVVGTGPEVKSGKKVQVYYEGRLKQNNKVFDSVKQGAGFKFNVGRGDVIKAWDVGVVGMKVGGKRRITCPPHMAYGARGMPPQIPPNSTLVFEVEAKGV